MIAIMVFLQALLASSCVIFFTVPANANSIVCDSTNGCQNDPLLCSTYPCPAGYMDTEEKRSLFPSKMSPRLFDSIVKLCSRSKRLRTSEFLGKRSEFLGKRSEFLGKRSEFLGKRAQDDNSVLQSDDIYIPKKDMIGKRSELLGKRSFDDSDENTYVPPILCRWTMMAEKSRRGGHLNQRRSELLGKRSVQEPSLDFETNDSSDIAFSQPYVQN